MFNIEKECVKYSRVKRRSVEKEEILRRKNSIVPAFQIKCFRKIKYINYNLNRKMSMFYRILKILLVVY